MTYFVQLLTAFFGTIGFALLWNGNKKALLPVGVGGVLAWGVYLAVFHGADSGIFVAAFVSAVTAGVYAEIFARVLKTPTTVILIPSLVSLFPGSHLYYAVSAAAVGSWQEFRVQSLATVYFTLGIACGAGIISALIMTFVEIRKRKKNK